MTDRMWHYLFFVFAIFYMGQATEKLFRHFFKSGDAKTQNFFVYFVNSLFYAKPFICSFCMYFWWSVVLYLLSGVLKADTFYTITVICGLPGIVLILHALKIKLETITIS